MCPSGVGSTFLLGAGAEGISVELADSLWFWFGVVVGGGQYKGHRWLVGHMWGH